MKANMDQDEHELGPRLLFQMPFNLAKDLAVSSLVLLEIRTGATHQGHGDAPTESIKVAHNALWCAWQPTGCNFESSYLSPQVEVQPDYLDSLMLSRE